MCLYMFVPLFWICNSQLARTMCNNPVLFLGSQGRRLLVQYTPLPVWKIQTLEVRTSIPEIPVFGNSTKLYFLILGKKFESYTIYLQ